MFDIVILALLVAAVVCSIIELGLSAYIVSSLRDVFGRYYGGRVSSTFNFTVFASIWSLLVSLFLLGWGFVSRSRGGSEGIFAPLTLALNTITMIFWLAGFAAVADLYDGAPGGTPGALIAFGVILWLIFLALTVINFLTAFGVIKSERAGHSSVFSRNKFGASSGPTTTTTTTAV